MYLDEIFDYLPISQNWAMEWGDRVFWYDAFLSHRRFDGSGRLAKILREKFGLRVFHDGDADVRDLKVGRELTVALNNSRHVVACVGDDFDSDYCRAEYLSALDIEKQAGGRKVLVVEMKESASVPPELTSHPSFLLSENADESDPALSSLAKQLRDENLLPFDIKEMAGDIWLSDEVIRARVLERARATLGHPPADDDASAAEMTEGVLALTVSESLNSPGAFLLNLMRLRQYICREEFDWTQIPDETLRFARDVALVFGESAKTDNRANAAMVLIRLGRLGRLAEIRADVLKLLREECTGGLARPADADIVGKVIGWYNDLWPQLSGRELEAAQLGCLCVPLRVREIARPELIAQLPESVRVRLFFVRGLRIEVLPVGERLALIERRIKHIIERETSVERGHGFKTELELEFRELSSLLSEHGKAVDYDADEEGVYRSVIKIIDSVARASRLNRGLPLLYVGEYIQGYVLSPLLLCHRQKSLRKPAGRVYKAVCEVITRFSSLADEVPYYLALLERAQQGVDVSGSDHGANSRVSM